MNINNTNWMFYSIAHADKYLSKWAPEIFIKTLKDKAKKHPQVLGVTVDIGGEQGVILKAFIRTDRLVSLFEGVEPAKIIVDACKRVISGHEQVLRIPMDETDRMIFEKLKLNLLKAPSETPGEHMARVMTLMWSIRAEMPSLIDETLYAMVIDEDPPELETGDPVLINMLGGQSIYGLTASFGVFDGVPCADVVVAQPGLINVNGEVVEFSIGRKITAPVQSLEKLDYQIMMESQTECVN